MLALRCSTEPTSGVRPGRGRFAVDATCIGAAGLGGGAPGNGGKSFFNLPMLIFRKKPHFPFSFFPDPTCGGPARVRFSAASGDPGLLNNPVGGALGGGDGGLDGEREVAAAGNSDAAEDTGTSENKPSRRAGRARAFAAIKLFVAPSDAKRGGRASGAPSRFVVLAEPEA